MNYGWLWWYWTDAHEYFMSPFALFLWVGGFVCDAAYAFVLWRIRQMERVLDDGRKEDGGDVGDSHGKKRL